MDRFIVCPSAVYYAVLPSQICIQHVAGSLVSTAGNANDQKGQSNLFVLSSLRRHRAVRTHADSWLSYVDLLLTSPQSTMVTSTTMISAKPRHKLRSMLSALACHHLCLGAAELHQSYSHQVAHRLRPFLSPHPRLSHSAHP